LALEGLRQRYPAAPSIELLMSSHHWRISRRAILAAVTLLSAWQCVAAGTQITQPTSPPAASPMARGVHPRLFFEQSELPALRNRIARHYRGEFQDFVGLLNDPSRLSRRQRAIEPFWGSMNYAFVAALDPRAMAELGFSFDSSLDTSEEFCARAMTYVHARLPEMAAGKGNQGHSALATGYPTASYFPVAATYDWCYPHLSDSDRKAVVDTFVIVHKRWSGVNLLTAHGRSSMLANNQSSADVHDTLGILAFYKDPYPGAETQAELYRTFHAVWFDRMLTELNHFYGAGTFWHEGNGGYLADALVNIGIPVAMFSSALGTNYFATTPFFSRFGEFVVGNLKPHAPLFFERWGVIGGGISGMACKGPQVISGMLRRANHPNAGLTKWVNENVPERGQSCDHQTGDFGGPWANAVLYWFIYGDREVKAVSPTAAQLPTSLKLGLGEYVLKSSHEADASQVIVWANPWEMYGHRPETSGGHFTLHKFGNLILSAANAKSGEGVIEAGGNLFRNVIGLLREDRPTMQWDRSDSFDPFWEARGIRQIRHTGKSLAAEIGGDQYDYVAYDSSLSWSPSRADVSQREFLYLRGPLDKEFLVVFDRMNVRTPATDKKVWKIWVPSDPTRESANLVSMTNKHPDLRSDQFASPATHGKFFLKTLEPEDAQIAFRGGPGREFQSGDGSGATPWGAPPMTQAIREYLGWGRIEVQPRAAREYDLFLNVIQFGDADSLSQMAPVTRVQSVDGTMTGSHIAEPANEWVTLFASRPVDGGVSAIQYRVQTAGRESRHLLLNVARSKAFFVSAGSDGSVAVTLQPAPNAVSVTSSDQGVLYFVLSQGVVRPGSRPTAGS
jgi:hypothetical protein